MDDLQMNKLKIPYPIIVEGKYDRLRLLCVAEARIITTDGFGIFKKKEKLALLRKLAENTKIIILADSDGAGKLIRSHIGSAVPPDRLIQLYIPQIKGCEKRKDHPSAEGTLGVEGMEADLLYRLLSPYEDAEAVRAAEENPLSKTDFFEDGLSGGADSAARRDALAKSFGLPEGMTANALLAALRITATYDQYLSAVGRKIEEKD
jgi:ribonuclease M5